jgi:hypothetical protein
MPASLPLFNPQKARTNQAPAQTPLAYVYGLNDVGIAVSRRFNNAAARP